MKLQRYLLVLAATAGAAAGCGPDRQVLKTAGSAASVGGGPTGAGGSGLAGSVGTGGTGALGSCAAHTDCPAPAICVGGVCSPCSAGNPCSDPCPGGQQRALATRNGCSICECGPPSQCSADADCGAGSICYPGSQCAEGCSALSCCVGNHCARTGCEATPMPCVYGGCAGGALCATSCLTPSCSCDAGVWHCGDLGAGAQGGGGGACTGTCTSP